MSPQRSAPGIGPQVESLAGHAGTRGNCAPPEALFSLSFDHYQRYAVTEKIVTLLRACRGGRRFAILDIGGCGSSLKHYLPEDTVVLADIDPPPSVTHPMIPLYYDDYLLASGGQLPFKDESFDIIAAHDTLEHVPEPERVAFLQEAKRVARFFVILNGPVYQPETAAAERRLALFMERVAGEVHPFLREHIAEGLPRKADIAAVIREGELPFVTVPNGNLARWLVLMGIKFYGLSLPSSGRLLEVLERAYNAFFSPEDFGGLCYREAYIVAKNPALAEGLRQVEKAFAPLLARPPFPLDDATIESLLHALEAHAMDVQRQLAEEGQRSQALEAQVAEKDAALAEKDTALAGRDAALAEKDASLADTERLLAQNQLVLARLEGTLHEATTRLEAIEQSLGYNLLDAYRRMMRFLFPRGAWWGLPYRATMKLTKGLLRRILRGRMHSSHW